MTLRERVPALFALAIPVLAGALWMLKAGAPVQFALSNCTALLAALVWASWGNSPASKRGVQVLTIALLALLVVPLFLGPVLRSVTGDEVARWLPLGPVALHSGMLALPALAVLAVRDGRHGFVLLLLALAAFLFQPDAASGFALTFAAVGLHHAGKDWRIGLVAIAGFLASISMSLAGELAPQPFVERVIVQAAADGIVAALALALALAASFCLILFAVPLAYAERFALAGSLFGFGVMSFMSNYPSPLIGYGAAPILGYGLALGLVRKIEK